MKQDYAHFVENTTQAHSTLAKTFSTPFAISTEADIQTDINVQVTKERVSPLSFPTYPTMWSTRSSAWLPFSLFLALLALVSISLIPLMLLPTPERLQQQTMAMPQPFGMLSFLSSGQFNPSLTAGYNDTLVLTIPNLLPPPMGMVYGVWLMPDKTDDSTAPLLLGTLQQAGPVHLTYTSPNHSNLLASYSGVRIDVQPADARLITPSPDPKTWKWDGWISNVPTPGDEQKYSLLSHLRHLIAEDPTLQQNHLPGGLDLWLTRNVSKIEEYASAAQGDWYGTQTSESDAEQIHRHMLRILDYLDGSFYVGQDVPAGSPWLIDPLAGKIGLLESVPNQMPPAYLVHIDLHLIGLANSPGHTQEQQRLAVLIDRVINKMLSDLQHIRADAAKLVKMDAQQLRQSNNQSLLDDMANLTTEVKSGWFDSRTGEDIGGVVWISSRLQQLATISLNVSKTND